MTFIVVGVDGGGSKTRVLVADEHGGQDPGQRSLLTDDDLADLVAHGYHGLTR